MHWLRLYSEARTDNKLRMLDDAQHRVWFNLLCYAGEQHKRGEIHSWDDFTMAIECAGGDEALLQSTVELLVRLRILEILDDNAVRFTAWEERQYDKPSDRPEATAERKRRSREKTESHAPPSNKEHDSRDVTPGHAPYTEQNRVDTEQSRAEVAQARDDGASAPPKPKTKRATEVPDDWWPTPELILWAAEKFRGGLGYDAIVEDETQKFVRHHRSKGNTFKNIGLAWQNWMTRAHEYGKARASPNSNGKARSFVEIAEDNARERARNVDGAGTHPRSLLANTQGRGERSQGDAADVERDAGRRAIDALHRKGP